MEQRQIFIPALWEQIPDLGLYMDQVVTYVTGVLCPLYGEPEKEILTASMVNNYVKQGLVPRPQGKKYSREHLARLLMISFLKKTMAMEEIQSLFDVMGQDVQAAYSTFARCQQEVLCQLAPKQCDARQVMYKAICVAAARIDCLQALQALRATMPVPEKEKRERRRKQDD